MNHYVSEPLYDGFNGIYIGSNHNFEMPPNDIDFSGIIKYMKETNKSYRDLTENEINKFKYSKS